MSSGARVPVREDESTARELRGTLALLGTATAVGSMGLAAGGTAGPLLAVQMTGTNAAAGVPVALNLAGSAVGALLISRLAALGRRGQGLALGFATGALGAAVVVVAAAAWSFGLVLAGSMLLGCANAAVFLSRYAAVVAVPPHRRGRALGRVLFATSVGAVISPMLLGPGGSLAAGIGLAQPTGAYLVAVAGFGCAAVVFWALAGRLAAGRTEPGAGRGLALAIRDPKTLPAIITLAVTNFAMVGVMTVAPVQLGAHGNGLEMVGLVVALHVVCMFGPSLVTGYLADRFHPIVVIVAGGVLLLAGGAVGMFAGEHGAVVMTVHLLLIGLGWNGGMVGGSALLSATAPVRLRTHLEGIGEAAMNVAAVAAAPLAGAVSVLTGYAGLSICFGVSAAAGLTLSCRRARVRGS
ncbi:MAG TPA: MFS transporter [Amycolatopsis sp.]|uniref:MFS transporter n=1 Tax=Amycolatopsis sp. TaxID=37632 RepID=UPI002B487658|nr:MFS transporter [Amycolatopsis sp.]HKS47325.1 MFS transporter [Amycolatopsis sp.]